MPGGPVIRVIPEPAYFDRTGAQLGALGTSGLQGNPVGWNLQPNSSWRLGPAFWNLSADFAVTNGSLGEGGMLTYVGPNTAAAQFKSASSTIYIPVQPAQLVTLSGDMLSGVTSGSVYVQFSWFNAAKVALSNIQAHADLTGWKRYSISEAAPPNTAYVQTACFIDQSTIIGASRPAWKRLKLEMGAVATPYTAEADLWPSMFPGVLIPGLNAAQVGSVFVRLSAGMPQWSVDGSSWNPWSTLPDGTTPQSRMRSEAGFGVATGLAVTPGTGLSVVAAAGRCYLDSGDHKTFAAATTAALAAANATNPRKDVLYVDSGGVIQVVQGTPAVAPVEPAIPATAIKLAVVTVAKLATSIVAGNIVDARKFLVGSANGRLLVPVGTDMWGS